MDTSRTSGQDVRKRSRTPIQRREHSEQRNDDNYADSSGHADRSPISERLEEPGVRAHGTLSFSSNDKKGS